MKAQSHRLVVKVAYETLIKHYGIILNLKKLQKGSTIPDYHVFWRFFSHRKEHLLDDVILQISYLAKLIRSNAPVDIISYKLGVVSHFISDFFTAPHNFYTKRELPKHIRYEKELKHFIDHHIPHICTTCIEYKENASRTTFDIRTFIEAMYNRYEKDLRSHETDMRYAVEVFSTIILFLFDQNIHIISPHQTPKLAGFERNYLGRRIIRKRARAIRQLSR